MTDLFKSVDELAATSLNVLDGLRLQKDFMSEVSTEVHCMLNGDQVISFLRTLKIPESDITQARLLIVGERSWRNSDAFFDAVKLGINDSPINIEPIGNGVKLLNALNEGIQSVTAKMFEVLNASTLDDRFHKSICLRRDICRMKLIASRYANMTPGVDIDWSCIDVQEDYIDGAVDFSFLVTPTQQFLKLDGKKTKEWWEALGNISDLIDQIQYRLQFIKRLKVFNLE